MTKVRSTMLSKNHFHFYIVKMKKWVAFVLIMYRKKLNKVSLNSDRLPYKTIWWCLNIRDKPHFKLDTLDIDTWSTHRNTSCRHLTYPSLGGGYEGWILDVSSCIGKHTGRNNSISCILYWSIAFIKATCTVQNVRTFGVLINEPYKQEIETLSTIENIRIFFQTHIQL